MAANWASPFGSKDAMLSMLQERAVNGDQEALFRLAKMYETGYGGVEMSLVKACEYMDQFITAYHRSKDSNSSKDLATRFSEILYARGTYLLGARTPVGCGSQQELPFALRHTEKGLELLEEAGDLGHMQSITFLGNMYMTGQPPISRNVNKGIKWFTKGAQLGNGQNAFQLSGVFRSGLVPKNDAMAEKWEQVAAKLGYQDAVFGQGGMPRPQTIEANQEHRENEIKTAKKMIKRLKNDEKMMDMLGTDERNECGNPPCKKIDKDLEFTVCGKCLQVKYCSRKCAKAHFHGGHKKECDRLERTKDELSEQNRNVSLAPVMCFNPGCSKLDMDKNEKFKKCSKCNNAKYCSRDCQLKHWKAGHRRECKTTRKLTKAADGLLSRNEK